MDTGTRDGTWLGGVGTWRKYVGSDLNEYYGYQIKYDYGDKYNMIEAYREWCQCMKYEVKDENALENRALSKLQTVELKEVVRARGIFYSKIHHVLLCAFKSQNREAKQAEVCSFLQQLKVYSKRMVNDASFIIDNPDDKLFADDQLLHDEYNKWADNGDCKVLIDNLMRPDAPSPAYKPTEELL